MSAFLTQRLDDNWPFVLAAFGAWAVVLLGLIVWVGWRRRRLQAALAREANRG